MHDPDGSRFRDHLGSHPEILRGLCGQAGTHRLLAEVRSFVNSNCDGNFGWTFDWWACRCSSPLADTHRKARNKKGLPCFRGGPGSVWSGLLACGCAISPSGDYLFRLKFLYLCIVLIKFIVFFISPFIFHLHVDFHFVSFPFTEAVLHSLQ